MLLNVLKRNPIFRKAEKVKDLYFEKLDAILDKLRHQEAAVASLAANDTSVLEALAYLVEKLKQEQTSRQEHEREVESRLASLQRSLEAISRALDASPARNGETRDGEGARGP
jgi:predicted ATP-binding protein involved in virulence